jgi:hypothetical protein
MADDANLGFERQSASYEKFLRGTMSAFNERLQVAEQDRSLRIVTRLIVLGADHDPAKAAPSEWGTVPLRAPRSYFWR